MTIGERIKYLRKSLNLTQQQFANALDVDQGHIAGIEKGTKNPSKPLQKAICLTFHVRDIWLKTGEGEMFISPEDALKSLTARFGEQAVLDAVTNIMKERGLVMAAGRPAHQAGTGDPDLDRLLNTIYDLWTTGDSDLKGWLKVQLRRAIPDDVIEDAQKKQKATQGQASAG
ncbi:helix-turn-helix transcriptional regulator [Pelotomaculum propionicicum]|uniref:HTH cro/C1-type domain-containing protein n=1 Tax=Pelotomaculum propionicicum TaxID=258475 RepID=A0A4Y7RNS8_9FIRM|nr:helix-turn-helix transcriptional regulator [Pelotomaculum propionicicum]TEB10648.1 hypothetical protein Pmgp_02228 [Pelotomaculum propionicicum]